MGVGFATAEPCILFAPVGAAGPNKNRVNDPERGKKDWIRVWIS